MNLITKPVTLNWWQITLFKLSMVSLGILLVVWFPALSAYPLLFLMLFLLPAFYLVAVWLKQ